MAEPTDKPAKTDKPAPKLTSAQWSKVGVAMGIGSAGLVAALLYANRNKKPGNKG